MGAQVEAKLAPNGDASGLVRSEARKLAFRRFPNSVARDKLVTPQLLVLLAYRSTYIDRRSAFGLNERALSRTPIVQPQTGMGKNNIRKAIALGQELGYITRRQLPRQSDGTWSSAVDRLALPKCGETGHAGRHVKRAWFDSSLSLDAMAAFIYIRAGTGKGPSVYASELRSRFGWSRPKAAKALNELIGHNVVRKMVSRSDLGRMQRVAYEPNLASAWSIWSTVKKPGDGLRGDGKPGDLRSYPGHELSKRETFKRTLRGNYTAQTCSVPTVDFDEVKDHAWSSPRLLNFEMENLQVLEDYLADAASEFEAIEQVCSDSELKAALQTATQGRVHRDILSPAGLYSVRMLAAIILVNDVEQDNSAADVLGQVLEAISERIGNHEEAWLNSLSVIGQRIAGDLYSGYSSEIYRPKHATAPASLMDVSKKTKKVPPALAATISKIKQADGALVLSPGILNDHTSLRRLLALHPNALEVIHSILTRAMIDGPPVGSITSWSYFNGPLEDDRAPNELARLGLAPGDCFGAHKRKGQGHA